MASYTYQHATAYVYTYDAATGALSSQLMRVPGGCHSSSSHRAQRSPSPGPLAPLPTLGKDTQGLIDEVVIRRGEAVYFIEKAGQAPTTTTNGSEKENVNVEGRKTGSAMRRVMREVREVELMARRLEEALCMDEEAEDDDDEDDDDDDEDEDDDDEDESDDEDDDDESDYEEEESMISEAEASLFGGSDEEDEEIASVEVSVVDGLCAEVESESDDEDEEGEWETVAEAVKERAMALFGDEDDWEAALFGGTEDDEADHMDVDKNEASGIPGEHAPTMGPKASAVEEWTRASDWSLPIMPLPSTHFNVLKLGSVGAQLAGNTAPVPVVAPKTPLQASCSGAGTSICGDSGDTNIHRPARTTSGTKTRIKEADLGTRADVTRADEVADHPRADFKRDLQDLRADLGPRADPGRSADLGRSADRADPGPRADTVADARTMAIPRTEADVRTRADARMRADVRTHTTRPMAGTKRTMVAARTAADQRTRTDHRTRAHPGTRADVDRRADPQIKPMAYKDPMVAKPSAPMRTDFARMDPTRTKQAPKTQAQAARDTNHRHSVTRMPVPRTQAPTVTKTAPAARVNSPAKTQSAGITSAQLSTNAAASAAQRRTKTAPATPATSLTTHIQAPGRGTKRKADEDDDSSTTTRDPQVSDALARSKSLAGLKFKKMKTCHSILTTEKAKTATINSKATTAPTATTSKTPTFSTNIGPKTREQQGRQPGPSKTAPKVRWCLDGDQKLPGKFDSNCGFAGRKRKNDERDRPDDGGDKEEGELSDSEDDVPLAKRHKSMQLPRRPTYDPRGLARLATPTTDYGSTPRRRDDRQHPWMKTTGSQKTMMHRRPQAVQFGR
ncbi:hypothetical protein GY45DRAFT_1371020 [Cubamyces sp. BRFM 1775]|nr:hypothetical protein GY45DRAFT_1371020 [Cubamyces sp. BRFM 1775]